LGGSSVAAGSLSLFACTLRNRKAGYTVTTPSPYHLRADAHKRKMCANAHKRRSSADLFDVDRFPTATFRARVAYWSGSTATLLGELTIKDVTNPVELDVTYLGVVGDPWGGERAVFSASGTINREDWGVTWNVPLALGGLLVSKQIELEIDLETVLER
jgi:polyisoprenoid-binding protein YceI